MSYEIGPSAGVKRIKIGLIVAVLAATTYGAAAAYGHAAGPPSGKTGAPGEATCAQCHIGTLNSGPGSITIEGVPTNVEPSTEYTLTIKVQHPDRRRWGFQITALDASNKAAGSFILIDRNKTRIVNGTGTVTGRVYVEQAAGGTFTGQTGGAEWTVTWKSPVADAGLVTFYAAGNAANSNNSSSGDSIYTTAVTTGNAALPAIIAPSYKKGKISLQANGSNIKEGATLEVSGGSLSSPEIFPLVLNGKGTKWQVKSSARSTPGAKTVDQVLSPGSSVTLVVHNPDGSSSAPATLAR